MHVSVTPLGKAIKLTKSTGDPRLSYMLQLDLKTCKEQKGGGRKEGRVGRGESGEGGEEEKKKELYILTLYDYPYITYA